MLLYIVIVSFEGGENDNKMEYKIERNDTSEYIEAAYENLSKDEKIRILNIVVDLMQQYNGRTKFDCIAIAMGYQICPGEVCFGKNGVILDLYTKER